MLRRKGSTLFLEHNKGKSTLLITKSRGKPALFYANWQYLPKPRLTVILYLSEYRIESTE